MSDIFTRLARQAVTASDPAADPLPLHVEQHTPTSAIQPEPAPAAATTLVADGNAGPEVTPAGPVTGPSGADTQLVPTRVTPAQEASPPVELTQPSVQIDEPVAGEPAPGEGESPADGPAGIEPTVLAMIQRPIIRAATPTPLTFQIAPTAPDSGSDPAPTVRVHIGRLDVRANLEAPEPKQTRHEKATTDGLSLHDYLQGQRRR